MSDTASSGVVVWLTGLPSSGKSTLARRAAERLRSTNVATLVLDGDDVREALRPRPGYDDDARDAFYETLARLAALAASQGLVVLVPATAHRRAFRDRARALAPRFVEVHVDVPLATAEARDDKGFYARAHAAQSSTMPGVGVAYEAPSAPELVVHASDDVGALLAAITRL
ncbi:adenylyl-sulfate kinase [Sandaracinus amylolyticus]|uniref:Adenylylsulfate kinase n=1 Tax=Sandaracinus amylolyticus TaxID=927083 RepID=A0A0F6SE92_9BACT|nr:adenylyl-sulfate kinase [Sandaracinus amylolyticus]AKF04789.1 Adenylylsulfate kinase [Sandaracinus amylolyticus]